MPHPHSHPEYGPLLDRLTRRARRLVSDPEIAEELAQEAMLRLWQQQQGPHPPRAAEPFAMTVLRNLAMSHWRSHRQTDSFDEDSVTVPSAAHGQLALRDLAAAIARLPEDQQVLISMVAQGITSPAELARRTSLPVGTVMSRLSRARATLRRALALDHGSANLLHED